VLLVLTSLNKTSKTVGKLEGTFTTTSALAEAIRPDLHGFKIVLENRSRQAIFTALLPAGAKWSSTRGRVWRFRDQNPTTGVSSATIRLKKVGRNPQLIVGAAIKKATVPLTRAALPIYLNIGFGPGGTAPCSQRKLKSSACTMPPTNTQVTCRF